MPGKEDVPVNEVELNRTFQDLFTSAANSFPLPVLYLPPSSYELATFSSPVCSHLHALIDAALSAKMALFHALLA